MFKNTKRVTAFFIPMTLVFSIFLPFSGLLANTVVWSLNEFLSGRTVGSIVSSEGDLWEAGLGGKVSVHTHNSNLGVHAVERSADWQGIDVRASTGIQAGDIITVTGRVQSAAAGEAARLVRQPGHDQLTSAALGSNGSFTLTHTLTADEHQGLSAIRINTTETSSFYIDTIVITRSGAAAATPAPQPTPLPPVAAGPKTVERTITRSNSGGQNINGWHVELWTQATDQGKAIENMGGVEMIVYSDGSFDCSWDRTFNTLFRTGRRFGNNTRINSMGDISVSYSTSDFSSPALSLIGLYGWTRNSLVEWYVIEDWRHYRKGGDVGRARSGVTHHGTIDVDGGTYDIYTEWRVNQPSIAGNTTFLQVYSVRHQTRTSGTINLSAHFDAWRNVGEITHAASGTSSTFSGESSLYEIAYVIEGFGGSRLSSGSAKVNQLCVNYGGSNALCTSRGCGNCTGAATPTVFVATPTPAPATPAPTAPATPGNTPIVQFEINSLQYLNRGNTAFLDAAPFIVDGRTMVPFRTIAEALGATIEWDEATKTVSFTRNGASASLTIDVPLPNDMGTPVIRDGRTFVPVRYVSEVLNSTVGWDEDTKTVSIY